MDPKLLTLIDTAIRREEEAYAFYMAIHGQVKEPAVREAIAWIAGEEQKHKAFLVKYRQGEFGAGGLRLSDVAYYKIAEHQSEPEVKENMNSAEVYLVAAHRELRSYHFYTALSNQHAAGEAREMLLKMANEELKHKENTAFPQTSGG
jgi:rubrerythrin